MTTNDDGNSEDVHAFLYIDASDLPASRKAAGLRSHSSKKFMCTVCRQQLPSLTDPDAFDPERKSPPI